MTRCHPKNLLAFLEQENLMPKRTLSQNFLIDENVVEKIISNLEIVENDIILEIGPGAGALTEKLCQHPIHLVCVEKDYTLSRFLNFSINKTKSFEVVCQDILDFNFEKFNKNKKIKVISNLPYHITSKILKLLAKHRSSISHCIVMTEKGYAEDLMAADKKKSHDATSFYLHHAFEITSLFSVSKNCFFPKPKIDSSVLKLYPKDIIVDELEFYFFIEILFQNKRKMLQSTLKNFLDIDLNSIFPKYLETLQLRPEKLTNEQALEIFSLFKSQIKEKINTKKTDHPN